MAVVSELAVAVYGFKPIARVIEPAGIAYEFHVVKDKLALGHCTLPIYRNALATVDSASDLEKLDDSDLSWLDKDDSKYRKYMSKLDPGDVKDQDHYKVLGLSKLRYKASSNQVKLAYRQKVLKYHPDKGNVEEKDQKNERIFGCIQKAYEQLGMSVEKRRAYDSVDPTFDETIPSASEINKQNFFKVLAPVFERNARFSNVLSVPSLGDVNSDRAYVDSFYEFWFNWSSWREFSYLDSEDKTKGEDKWERREIEKLNRAEREKRRKKDVKRISALVDLAYEKDPRISAFKEAERRQKEQIKEQKRAERERKEQERRAVEAEEERAREAERQAQLERDKLAVQARQKKRKLLAGQRKKLRDLCTNAQYWTEDDNMRLSLLEQVERICINADFDEISSLCERLTDIRLFDDAIQELKLCAMLEGKTSVNSNGKSVQDKHNGKAPSNSDWSNAELQLLVKAVGLFPPGTAERWRFVAEYVSNHALTIGGKERTEKEIIKQVKALSAVDSSSTSANQIKDNDSLLRENGAALTNNDASNGKEKIPLCDNNSNDTSLVAPAAATVAGSDNWSPEQQKQLETALKMVPASDTQRWERIAGMVDGKTKKDCVKRYKHLAELVKQSKKKT